jgi:hypothetical protein
MKILIVFEDRYGIFDIFMQISRKYHNVSYKEDAAYIELSNSLSIVRGLGNISTIGLKGKVLEYAEYSDVCISVFDIDKVGVGCKNAVVSDSEVISLVDKSKYCGQRLFMPVIYNAETIMLYQYLHGLNGMDVVDIVHSEDTFKLQLNLLSEVVRKVTGVKSVKKVNEYLDIDKLLIGIDAGRDDANFYLKRWLRSGCEIDMSLFASKEDLLQEIHKARDNMSYRLTMNVDKYYIDSRYYIDATTTGAMKPILRDM